jgi:hypothetical protein
MVYHMIEATIAENSPMYMLQLEGPDMALSSPCCGFGSEQDIFSSLASPGVAIAALF